jgi:hypothetical protein
MKINRTVVLTLLLLIAMLASGGVSGMLGFTLGSEALKGITQPDISPSKKQAVKKRAPKQSVEMLSERDIIKQVKEHINKNKNAKPDKAPPPAKSEDKDKNKEPDKNKNSALGSFPFTVKDQGVTLEVKSSSIKDNNFVLSLGLKNETTKPIRFLYSFLNVNDDQGNALTSVTEGLPGELPGNNEEFTGTVSIPTSLLKDAQKLSLNLTDYPDQKLQLKVANIPVDKQ